MWAAAAASLAEEVTAWQKRDFGNSGSALGSVVAAWRQQRQHSIGSGSVALVEAEAAVVAWHAAQQRRGRGGMC